MNEIRGFSQIEPETLTLESISFQLTDVIEQIQEMLSEQVFAKGLLLRVERELGGEEALLGDPLLLKKILIHLLQNAVKFTEQGEILLRVQRIESEEDQTTLQFTVRDTGIGMSALTQRTLFQFFRQADAEISKKYWGTGLGLASSKALIHMMGGAISVSSAQGQGTEFRFSIPFASQAKKGMAPCSWPQQPPVVSTADLEKLRGARILLVEDNEINQDVAVTMLAQKEIKTRIAVNGRQALNILKQEEFDCVLMDIQMPVMDGYSTTKAIRRNRRYRDLPILAMTANALVSDERRSLEAGMNGHISKPVAIDTLFHELVRWIDPYPIMSRYRMAPGGATKDCVQKSPRTGRSPHKITGNAVVDMESSLERVGGNRDLHIKILKTFVGKHADDYRLVAEAIAINDIKEAKSLTHSLKGVALIVGSDALYDTVTRLDRSLEREASERYQKLLEEFKGVLEEVISFIELFFASEGRGLEAAKESALTNP